MQQIEHSSEYDRHEFIHISNHLQCQRCKCTNEKTEVVRMDQKIQLNYMLSARNPL